MNGQQPVMRGPLAESTGMGDGDETCAAVNTSPQPPTVTTTAPPAGVPAGAPAAVAPTPTPAPARQAAPVATTKPAPVTAAKPAPAPAPTVAAKPAPAAAAAKPAAGGSWYAGQSPSNYVVQILGTSNEGAAQAYVKEQGGDFRYFKKTLQGKPLYVITYGSFASRDAAVAAIKNLPAKVQAGKPWPRTVASVQQDLATAR